MTGDSAPPASPIQPTGTSPVGAEQEERARDFTALRPTLFGAAYRVLGSNADAEDVVQEAWLRWADVDRAEIREPRAYLLTITTRQALNRLRQQRNRRENYVGPWLPEPVATTPDAAESVELADSVSMAMLVVLETLSPMERATFVLREVFGLPFSEIASTVDKSEAAVRQLAHRARSHVQARRPRQPVDPARHRAVTERFLAAVAGGDLTGLVTMLAPDVVLVSDGGGVKRAALRPIVGADKVLRWLIGVIARPENTGMTVELGEVNGEAAMITRSGTEIDNVTFFTVEEAGITALHIVRNPDKLTALNWTR